MSPRPAPLRLSAALALVASMIVTLGVVGEGFSAPPTGPGNVAPVVDPVPAGDPIMELRERLAAGELTLAFDSAHGYLPALLDALDVPVSSQTLVFSRTSLQTDRIAPWAPRALYFNDDVYIGWVQESPIIEIAAIDPEGGAVFYTLSQTEPTEANFRTETTTCLMCHESRSVTGGPPGLIIRSVVTDRLGYPITDLHPGTTTARTPIERRWGGWYVTGTHGMTGHSGNVYAEVLSHEVSQRERFAAEFDFSAGSNVTDLGDRFFTDAYLTPHSDLVALMVLTHQVQVHNLISLVRSETEAALELEAMQRGGGTTGGDAEGHLPGTLARVTGPVARLLDAMLFVGEVPLPGQVRGTSDFASEFPLQGPHDAEGRTLRELDLETRVFRYPFSFLVHSDAFRSLPELPRRLLAERLMEVLTGAGDADRYAHLTEDDRGAALEILMATEPELLELARE